MYWRWKLWEKISEMPKTTWMFSWWVCSPPLLQCALSGSHEFFDRVRCPTCLHLFITEGNIISMIWCIKQINLFTWNGSKWLSMFPLQLSWQHHHFWQHNLCASLLNQLLHQAQKHCPYVAKQVLGNCSRIGTCIAQSLEALAPFYFYLYLDCQGHCWAHVQHVSLLASLPTFLYKNDMFACIQDFSSALTQRTFYNVKALLWSIWSGRRFKMQLLPPSDILAIGVGKNRIQGGENSSNNHPQRWVVLT